MRNLWYNMITPLYRGGNSGLDFSRDRFTVQDIEFIEQARKNRKLEILGTTIRYFSDENSKVELANGMILDIDICVMATGYKTAYPFLGPSSLGETKLSDLVLFRDMIPVDSSLLGLLFMYTTGFSGGGFCQMEAEARWLTHQIASNRLSSKQEHRRLVENSTWCGIIFNQGRKRSSFVITEGLARDMGCEPRLLFPAVFSLFPWRRRVALAVALGPWLPHLYRLRGPHAKPQQVESIVVQCARDRRGLSFGIVVAAVDIAHCLFLAGAVFSFFLCLKRLRAWHRMTDAWRDSVMI